MKLALQLHEKGYMQVSISRELDIHPSTLRRWFREAGIKPIKKNSDEPKPEDTDPLQSALDASLQKMTKEEAKIAKFEERQKEEEDIMNLAEAQSSPADKYQTYVASQSIKLLRDSMKNLRGPRTVKEFDILDQLIRRNLGLNARNTGGSGSMQIDISILNNTKADNGEGAVKITPKKVIDIEPLEDE